MVKRSLVFVLVVAVGCGTVVWLAWGRNPRDFWRPFGGALVYTAVAGFWISRRQRGAETGR